MGLNWEEWLRLALALAGGVLVFVAHWLNYRADLRDEQERDRRGEWDRVFHERIWTE